jgi:class 3 adenylate cyclase/predicted ATPase
MSDIRAWLEDLKLTEFADAFEAERIDLEALPDITDADLKEMGLPIGSRRKLLRAVAEGAPAAEAQREAERRQITVMFCDLVGSTALSETLDPEDLRSLMQAYQQAAGTVIERYRGHVAQYLGDGLMTYFGWPQAHEDDAERAVRAGLDIVDAVKAVKAPEPLQVRVGIATGRVVVGETGAGDASVPKLAVGETPNLAARLQGLANTDQIVISASTRRLVGGTFDLDDLGAHVLKGIVDPVPTWRVTGIAQTEGRFEARGGRLTPFVGRDAEIAMIMERWQQAKSGDGQVVLLCGEPGIGKSRVTQVLRERVAEEPHIRLRYQCSPYYTNSALYPVIEQLERAAGFARDHTAEQKLDKLENLLRQSMPDVPATAALFASLLNLDQRGRYPPLNLSPQKQMELTLQTLAEHVTSLAAKQPVLMIFEDAHWIDPTTQELLDLVIPAVACHPALVMVTYRPEYEPPWIGLGHATPLTLTRLGKANAAAMVDRVTGSKPLPDEVLDQIIAKTDGVPLFVEELTKTVIESGIVVAQDAGYTLTGTLSDFAIPSTLQDSLMARLDRLSPVKEIAQIGACVGREFSYELLAAVSPLRDNELNQAVEQLVNSELVFRIGVPPDAKFIFKHALVQDAAYGSLLKSRRQQLHSSLADILESRFPDVVENEPETIAHHLTEAGRTEPAIEYWSRAGQLAVQGSNYVEAVAHLDHGLVLVPALPDPARRPEEELRLVNLLATPVMITKGYASKEAQKVYERAYQLCNQVGQSEHIYQALAGVSSYHMVVGDVRTALRLAEELLERAELQDQAGPLLEAHRSIGLHCFATAEFERSLRHLEKVRDLFDPRKHRDLAMVYGQDFKMSSHSLSAIDLAALGYPDQAIVHVEAALAEAKLTEHFFSKAYALAIPVIALVFLRDVGRISEIVDKNIPFCSEQRIPYYLTIGLICRGFAMFLGGRIVEGIEQMRDGIVRYKSIGSGVVVPHFNTLLAEALIQNEEYEEAETLLNESIAQCDRWGEGVYNAETHRVKGDLIFATHAKDPLSVENWYSKALEIARGQHAKLWELRAATSLARLWQSQGKTREAHDLLAPVYGWFTEGFDTADLKDAKALLDELK